jgi:hypothetical protein
MAVPTSAVPTITPPGVISVGASVELVTSIELGFAVAVSNGSSVEAANPLHAVKAVARISPASQ